MPNGASARAFLLAMHGEWSYRCRGDATAAYTYAEPKARWIPTPFLLEVGAGCSGPPSRAWSMPSLMSAAALSDKELRSWRWGTGSEGVYGFTAVASRCPAPR